MAQSIATVWHSLVSCTLVALLAIGSLEPLLHGERAHDTDCSPVIVVHDAAHHRISAPRELGQDRGTDHCVICHLFRTARGTATARTSIDELRAASVATPHARPFGVADGAATRLPARAPPSRA